jgi:hypothetical protein
VESPVPVATGRGGGRGAGSSVEVPAGAAEALAVTTDVPPALEEEEAGFLQLEVSNISPCAPLISRGCHLPFCFLVDRVTPIVPALAPAKELRSGAPATTRRRSVMAPRTTASVAMVGEASLDTAAVTGSLQEKAAAVSQVLVPRAPSQVLGQAHSESRAAGDREAAGAAADDDAPPRWCQLRGQPASAPECTPEVLVMW